MLHSEETYLGSIFMRFDTVRSGEARGAEDILGDADVVLVRLGVVDCIDLRLLLDRTAVGDFRGGTLLWMEAGSVCWCSCAVFSPEGILD